LDPLARENLITDQNFNVWYSKISSFSLFCEEEISPLRKIFCMTNKKFTSSKRDFLIDSRILIPQGYAGMAIRSQVLQRGHDKYTFIGTSGIRTCVGCIAYSNDGIIFLAHFDDEGKVQQAMMNNNGDEKDLADLYGCYVRNIKVYMHSPKDLHFILIPSLDEDSIVLSQKIRTAFLNNGAQEKCIPNQSIQETESCILHFDTLCVCRYDETKGIEKIKKDQLIRDFLHIPGMGMTLFRMHNGELIEQDINQKAEKDYIYMKSKPLVPCSFLVVDEHEEKQKYQVAQLLQDSQEVAISQGAQLTVLVDALHTERRTSDFLSSDSNQRAQDTQLLLPSSPAGCCGGCFDWFKSKISSLLCQTEDADSVDSSSKSPKH
jgi:hypothetical protein